MKINQLTKLAFLLFTLSGVVACSSTGEEADTANDTATEGESGIDATTRRSQELEAERLARAAAAEARIQSAALGTTVFYFDFDVSEFRAADRDVLSFHARDLAANPRKRRKSVV